jgi:hypothetical protein
MTLSWPKGLGFIGKNEYQTQEWFMNRLFKCAAILIFLALFPVPWANGGDLSEEYVQGRWAINAQDCSSSNSEYIEIYRNGTYLSTRSGKAEVVGFWQLHGDILELHLLTSPAFYQDLYQSLAEFKGQFEYFQGKMAVFNNRKDGFEAIGVIGDQMKRATAVRCK